MMNTTTTTIVVNHDDGVEPAPQVLPQEALPIRSTDGDRETNPTLIAEAEDWAGFRPTTADRMTLFADDPFGWNRTDPH